MSRSGHFYIIIFLQVHGLARARVQGTDEEKQNLLDTRGAGAQEEPEVQQGQGEGEGREGRGVQLPRPLQPRQGLWQEEGPA